MPIDAIVTFDRLECSRETDDKGHSEPYIWPVLMRVDDNTLATEAELSSINLADQNARIVIKEDMKQGDVAMIPAGQRTFVFRFDDNMAFHTVIVVVALLEQDETPDRAATAGYVTFRNELPKAVAPRLLQLNTADEQGDEEGVRLLIKEISDIVGPAVKATTQRNLTATEKLGVILGTLNLDDQISVAHKSFRDLEQEDGNLVSQNFALLFSKRNRDTLKLEDRYLLRGRFETRRVVRDRCQALVDKARAAQQVLNGIQEEINRLQKQLQGNPDPDSEPLPRDFLIEEIKRIRSEELVPADDNLDAARRALAQCRASSPAKVGGTVSVVIA